MTAFSNSRVICTIYLIIGLTIAITLAICMPPMMNPDEIAHFSRADQISRGHIIGQRFDARTAGGEIAVGIGFVNWAMRDVPMHPAVKVTREMISEANAAHWTDGVTRGGFANSVVYPPIFYIPSAIGIKIGKALDLRVTDTLYISRILSAVAAVVGGALAIFFSGTAAPWIFTILTLPTALSQSATSGQERDRSVCVCLRCSTRHRERREADNLLRWQHSAPSGHCSTAPSDSVGPDVARHSAGIMASSGNRPGNCDCGNGGLDDIFRPSLHSSSYRNGLHDQSG